MPEGKKAEDYSMTDVLHTHIVDILSGTMR